MFNACLSYFLGEPEVCQGRLNRITNFEGVQMSFCALHNVVARSAVLKTAKRACPDTWKKEGSMMPGGQLEEGRIRLNVFGPSTTNRPVHSEYNATQIDRSCMV